MQGDKGSAEDKLRLVLVWLLTSDALPSEPVMERVLASLTSAGADTTSVAYLRRMRSMKLTGQSAAVHLYICMLPGTVALRMCMSAVSKHNFRHVAVSDR